MNRIKKGKIISNILLKISYFQFIVFNFVFPNVLSILERGYIILDDDFG